MYKKVIVSSFLCVAMLLTVMFPIKVKAVSDNNITSPSAVLMETSSGKVIYQKNSHEKRACASVTKVMTLLLVFEALDSGKIHLDDNVTASEHASSMGGSDIWLEKGETMSVNDMIKATVVASANDAAVALAEHISGSEDAFVEQMNQRAKQLKMNDTTFKNCNGLDEDGHITSANDVGIMSCELMKHKKIFDYTSIWIDNLRGGKTQIVNTNKLLKTYNGITGLKTGTTNDAGCCMAASAKRGNVSLVAVVLGCKTGKERFADAAALLDYGFANVAVRELSLPEDMPKDIPVEGGMADKVCLKCDVSSTMVIDKGSSKEIKTNIILPKSIKAPIKKGQTLGTLEFSINGKTVKKCSINAMDSVDSTSFGTVWSYLFNSLTAL